MLILRLTISRIIDFDDYSLNDDVFHMLDFRWGPHTIDRFACSYNAKLSCFNSRFFQTGSEAVDAVLQNWRFEDNSGFSLQFRRLRGLLLI